MTASQNVSPFTAGLYGVWKVTLASSVTFPLPLLPRETEGEVRCWLRGEVAPGPGEAGQVGFKSLELPSHQDYSPLSLTNDTALQHFVLSPFMGTCNGQLYIYILLFLFMAIREYVKVMHI